MSQISEGDVRIHPYVKGANQLNELCQQLFKNTPINFFEPFKIFKNNEYSGLMSDGFWAETFLKKGYQNSGIAKFQESYLKSDYTLWSVSAMYLIGDCAKRMRQDCVDFNYGHGITLIERHENYTQLYYFGSSTNNYYANEYFINNLDLLNKFVLYFEEQCRKDNDLFTLYNQKLHCQNEVEHDPRKFLENGKDFTFNPNRIYFQSKSGGFYLTKTEYACVKHVMFGLKIKEIARKLNISPRTVESHLNLSKQRSGSANLSELVAKIMYKLKVDL